MAPTMYDKSSSANHPMKAVVSPLARFGIDVLAGVGLALAVSGMIAALFTATPAPTVPKASAAPITQPAPTPSPQSLTVAQLRTAVRQAYGPQWRSPGGRRAAQARRVDLITALL
jgi:hypothetical protein